MRTYLLTKTTWQKGTKQQVYEEPSLASYTLGAYSLGAYNLAACSLGQPSLELEDNSLHWERTVWEPKVWRPTISLDIFWSCGSTHSTGGLDCWGPESGSLHSLSTGFAAVGAITRLVTRLILELGDHSFHPGGLVWCLQFDGLQSYSTKFGPGEPLTRPLETI